MLVSGAEQNVAGEFAEGKGPFAGSVFAVGIFQCCEALLISFWKNEIELLLLPERHFSIFSLLTIRKQCG